MLYSVVHDPIQTANELNHDLQIIQDWAYQWKMSFNPDPTKQAKELLFTRKKISPDHPNIVFNGSTVTKVNEHKHLGLVLQSNLSFNARSFSQKVTLHNRRKKVQAWQKS